jgi:hypothetical protein
MLWITANGDSTYKVAYLIGGKERRYLTVHDWHGLDWAIAEGGKYLASQPPLVKGRIGSAKQTQG